MSLVAIVLWSFRLSSLLIAAATLRILLAPAAEVMPVLTGYLPDLRLPILAHVAFAPVALALAPFQTAARLRRQAPRLHRALGYGYALSVLVSSLGALALLPGFQGSDLALVGFAVLGVLWLGVTAVAVKKARDRDFAGHRAWMLRSVALTFAAVTLRLYMAPMVAMGIEPLATYDVTAWASWAPNLLMIEWWLRRAHVRRRVAV